MKNYQHLMFGYKSWTDFKESNLGKLRREFMFGVVCVLLTFWFGIDTVIQSIETNIFSPAHAFVLAMASIFVDWLSGMYRGYINDNFSTKKAQRILPKLLANSILLAGYFYLHKYFIVPLGIDVLSDLVETGKIVIALAMFGIHAVSFLSNAAEANLIHGRLATWIMSKVDKHKKTIDDLI